MDLNELFRSKYNLLDDYCKKLAGIGDSESGIYLLEKVLDIRRASYLKTIRHFKNVAISHNATNVTPTVPREYVDFLNSEIYYIETHEDLMREKLLAASNNSRSQNGGNNSTPKEVDHGPHSSFWMFGEEVRIEMGHSSHKTMRDIENAAYRVLADFYEDSGSSEFGYDLFPDGKFPRVTRRNKTAYLTCAAKRWVNSLYDWEVEYLLNCK